MAALRTISQAQLPLAEEGAVYIDVREPAEFRGERWPGSVNVPLSRFDPSGLAKDKPVVVLCRSGRRSNDAAERLVKLGFNDVRVLEGGLSCCAGLEKGPGGVWAMERQVRFAAGALVLLGVALGFLINRWYFLLAGGVGAGLVFSATTDTCTMALVLARLPWNR